MTAYTGKDLAISWIYTGGTIALEADYRALDYTPTVEMFDQSAGSDAAKTYVAGQVDGTINISALMQSGGTVLKTALKEGNGGTIIFGPEGTASGKEKVTIPAISQGAKTNIQYNSLTELTCSFQQNGLRTDGVY